MSDEQILVVLDNGVFYTTDFDINNHYEQNIMLIEKFKPEKVWCACLYDADQQNYPYIKRFTFEASSKPLSYLGENKDTKLILLTDEQNPQLKVIMGGNDDFRDPILIDASEFIGLKSFKAKGKRITTWTIDRIEEIPQEKTEHDISDEEGSENEQNASENENQTKSSTDYLLQSFLTNENEEV